MNYQPFSNKVKETMRYKIYDKFKNPIRKKFLFFPRYCGKCAIAYLWEKINFVDGTSICPRCGKGMWQLKSNAFIYK